MFELTGEYTIILPLMVAIVLATGISHLLSGDTIYTLKLRRRGVDLTQSPEALALAAITVEQVMEPIRGRLPDATTLAQAIGPLSRAPHGQLPVTDRDGRYRGIATARAVADALADGAPDDQTVASLVELPDTVSVNDKLEHALDTLENARSALPVLDAERATWSAGSPTNASSPRCAARSAGPALTSRILMSAGTSGSRQRTNSS